MGYEYFPFDETKKSSNPDIIIDQMSGWHKPTNGHYKIQDWYLCRTHKELAYDRKWDWLMPVVEKIMTMDTSVTIENNLCKINTWARGYNKTAIMDTKQAIYLAVVEYIKWYNLNSKTPLSIIKNNG